MREWIVALALACAVGCAGPQAGLLVTDSDSNSSDQSSNGSDQSSNGSDQSSNSDQSSEQSSNQSAADSTEETSASGGASDGSTQASNNSAAASGQSAQSSEETANSSEGSLNNLGSQTEVPVTTVPIVSITVVGAIATGMGLLIWALVQPDLERLKAAEAAEAFLRVNERQLRVDLARGAGPTLEDLAAAARIRRAQLPRFSALLSAHRAEILRLADPDRLTPERAVTVLETIGALAREDPELRSAYLAFRESAR